MIEVLILTLMIVHVQQFTNSIYMHRGVAHGALETHPWLAFIFRCLMWFTTYQMTGSNWLQRYAAKHRMHHKYSDTKKDPHSPRYYSLKQLTNWRHSVHPGNANYISESDIKTYAPDVKTPDTWIDRNIFQKYPFLGTEIAVAVLLVELGWWGLLPSFIILKNGFFGTYIINYLSHKFGYKNYNVDDDSRNIFPIGIFQCGDELHNNHHRFPNGVTTRCRWWEFDLGYVYIKLLSFVGLIKINEKH